MKRTVVIRVLCAFAVWIVACRGCPAQTSGPPAQTPQKPESLEARIDRGEVRAFRDAGDLGRKDLIPAIENHAADEPWARAALAKLQVKKYLDEILLEATGPANHLVPEENEKHPVSTRSKHDRLWIRSQAFGKLGYIKDRSTVKVLISLLSQRENAEGSNVGGDMIFLAPSEMAMQTLAQIVDNPPLTNRWESGETQDARIEIWQQWWEKNKDKYP